MIDHPNLVHIARVCHEVNRAYCGAIRDNSQVPWQEAPEWQRQSAIDGVAFLLANPDATAGACHANWVKDKLADGWTWGARKAPELKQHPCLVDFKELPFEQRLKDVLFVAIVRALS